jgi:hypothetical protein
MQHCNAILKWRDSLLPGTTGKAMKKAGLLSITLLFLVISPVWAKKNLPRSMMLPVVVTLNGAQVPAGTYELTCETHGSSVRVTLLKDGQFVATAPGAWVKTGIKYSENEVLVRVNPEGSKSLIEIRFAGAARAIVFDHTDDTVHFSALQH